MANNYFRFKQFLINQDNCAMKVCTDSCILGAYADVAEARSVLDIGTGTGLLALMAAQRSGARITALEIDDAAANQAQENITGSKWAGQIILKKTSLQEFEKENSQLYDVILCNPPFYTDSHKSPDVARNVAMHSLALTFGDIIRFSTQFLSPEGKLWMLLPPTESNQFTTQARAENLFCHSILSIFTVAAGKHIRTIQAFSKPPCPQPQPIELFIRNADQSYSSAFRALLQEYYLFF